MTPTEIRSFLAETEAWTQSWRGAEAERWKFPKQEALKFIYRAYAVIREQEDAIMTQKSALESLQRELAELRKIKEAAEAWADGSIEVPPRSYESAWSMTTAQAILAGRGPTP